eukprot:CAMPEP_0174850132 /NCGR_PEP_ID=MMETSP1114-20130205/19059_1 /TAXON_ID=312471 /ORGANISM="Neobodo designis, Strain CCAP 1951/1" /LENGTH=193 /DNA_ID=CAMNT_0016084567 /DNA_START=109 /DNA_END=691 /DNA_ORIENTATION=+
MGICKSTEARADEDIDSCADGDPGPCVSSVSTALVSATDDSDELFRLRERPPQRNGPSGRRRRKDRRLVTAENLAALAACPTSERTPAAAGAALGGTAAAARLQPTRWQRPATPRAALRLSAWSAAGSRRSARRNNPPLHRNACREKRWQQHNKRSDEMTFAAPPAASDEVSGVQAHRVAQPPLHERPPLRPR